MFTENIANGEHSVGDTILVNYNGQQSIAKIVNVTSDNSYIVNLKNNQRFEPEPVMVTGDDIVRIIRYNAEEDPMKNWIKSRMDIVSNDVTNNNYPGNDGSGSIVYMPRSI